MSWPSCSGPRLKSSAYKPVRRSTPGRNSTTCGQAALEHLDAWVAGGSPPPPAPRLDLATAGNDLQRDEHGIATGGLRTPWVDVPATTLSGLGQTGEAFSMLFGTTTPFDSATLAAPLSRWP